MDIIGLCIERGDSYIWILKTGREADEVHKPVLAFVNKIKFIKEVEFVCIITEGKDTGIKINVHKDRVIFIESKE